MNQFICIALVLGVSMVASLPIENLFRKPTDEMEVAKLDKDTIKYKDFCLSSRDQIFEILNEKAPDEEAVKKIMRAVGSIRYHNKLHHDILTPISTEMFGLHKVREDLCESTREQMRAQEVTDEVRDFCNLVWSVWPKLEEQLSLMDQTKGIASKVMSFFRKTPSLDEIKCMTLIVMSEFKEGCELCKKHGGL